VSVCGTGAHTLNARGFSRGLLGKLSDCPWTLGTVGFGWGRAFHNGPNTYALQPGIPSPGVPFTAPSPRHLCARYGNVHPFSIGIPLRVILRARLTLIRLALIRKPWSIGGRVSRPPCRYLCLHLPFQPLQRTSPCAFNAVGMLPYLPIMHRDPRFGTALDARLLSTPCRSTSELLRTL
jgi:hypothetical protein